MQVKSTSLQIQANQELSKLHQNFIQDLSRKGYVLSEAELNKIREDIAAYTRYLFRVHSNAPGNAKAYSIDYGKKYYNSELDSLAKKELEKVRCGCYV
jgi:hypothetical protein